MDRNIRGCRRRDNIAATANAKDKTRYEKCEGSKPTLTTSLVELATKTTGIDQGEADNPPNKPNEVPIFADKSIEKMIIEFEKELEVDSQHNSCLKDCAENRNLRSELNDLFKLNWQEPKPTKSPTTTKFNIIKTVADNRGFSRTEGAGATKQFISSDLTATKKLDCDHQARPENNTNLGASSSYAQPEQPTLILKVKIPPPERGKKDCNNSAGAKTVRIFGRSTQLAATNWLSRGCVGIYIFHLIGSAD